MIDPVLTCLAVWCIDRPERNSLPSYYNVALNFDVQPTSMTLIISPASIYSQWASELQKHAPSLRVLLYTSLRAVKEDVTCQQLSLDYDIILTTFDVLRSEVGIARKPHEKSLRCVIIILGLTVSIFTVIILPLTGAFQGRGENIDDLCWFNSSSCASSWTKLSPSAIRSRSHQKQRL